MNQIDFDQARFNMVEQQIRTWEVLDMKVLDLMHKMAREEFVPPKYKNLAYHDLAIPLPHGQEMMHPKIEAHAIQAVDIKPTDVVLEIGTGSGYLTALLAALAAQVYSIEIFPDMLKTAGKMLNGKGITNITLEEGDGVNGWPDHAPYDVIVVTGSVSKLSEGLKQNLNVGGRMFVVVGDAPAMEAKLITRTNEHTWVETSIFETELAPLINASKPQEFIF